MLLNVELVLLGPTGCGCPGDCGVWGLGRGGRGEPCRLSASHWKAGLQLGAAAPVRRVRNPRIMRSLGKGLATFCLDKHALRDKYDDLSDLNAVQMESVREREMQFKENYDHAGRLLKPGEEPSEYTDEEDTKDHNK
ncbi:hypothetical protein P7K49_004694 [Saguinus oedipus]|uniref:Uncharacterized protein n=1 Tax=Saguinus oedipus TaxID=9490 RepID=A0ABQ9W867_SAGOE|nr:hypothetical protein P7K49_004694 [Saguinus oedipus]